MQLVAARDWAIATGRRVAVLGDREHYLALIGDAPSQLVTHIGCPQGSAPMYSLREQKVLRRAIRDTNCKALLLAQFPYPLGASCQVFGVVHDLTQTYPKKLGGQPPYKRAYARSMIRYTLKHARVVFTPSMFTKSELERLYPDANLCVVTLPIDSFWLEPPRTSTPARPMFLAVGNIKPHKNLQRLVEAFRRVSGRIPHDLVIAGGSTVDDGSWSKQLSIPKSISHRVRLLGRMDREALRQLISSATAVVMPSMSEGLGLPPLEAMGQGTATIVSNVTSLPETCGQASHYCDPYSADSIASALVKVGTDSEYRSRLEELGRRHVVNRNCSVDPLQAFRKIEQLLPR